MFRFLSTTLDEFLKVWFQIECPICHGAATLTGICTSCQPVSSLLGPICDRCGTSLICALDVCGECAELKNRSLDKARSALWLTNEAKVHIHIVKFQKRYEWLEIFKSQLVDSQFEFIKEDFAIISVPMHPKKFMTRGFNQSEILVDWIVKKRSMKQCFGLKKVIETIPQSLLDRSKRKSNLQDSFYWDKKYQMPKNIILVDDIYTTGETLNACAKVLKKNGAQIVYAWTLFRTIHRR